MAERKRNRVSEDRDVQKEVKYATSLESSLGQLDAFLKGESGMPSAAPSYKNSGKFGEEQDYPSGLDKPQPYHMDAESLAQKLGVSNPASIYAPAQTGPTDFTITKSGNYVLKRSNQPTGQPGYPIMGGQQQYYQPQFAFGSMEINSILSELTNFRFSQENKEKEIEDIKTALRIALNNLKTERVAHNTMNLAKNVVKFLRTKTGGVRGVFSVLGQKLSMRVEGQFTGDETLYLQVEGDSATGIVLVTGPDGRFVDASHNFEISVDRYEN